jgi:acetyltransferase-like isoleucine patch superfamily enzyme
MGGLTQRLGTWTERFRGALWCIWAGVNTPGRVRLGARVRIRIARGGQLLVRGSLHADRDAEIVVDAAATLELGDNVYIGHGSTIACASRITIGRDTLVGDIVSIRDMNHRRQPGVALRNSGIESAPIVIGENCWLGSKVTVVPGVTLGNDVTVGANAVVTRDFPAGVTIAGVPARVIGQAKPR